DPHGWRGAAFRRAAPLGPHLDFGAPGDRRLPQLPDPDGPLFLTVPTESGRPNCSAGRENATSRSAASRRLGLSPAPGARERRVLSDALDRLVQASALRTSSPRGRPPTAKRRGVVGLKFRYLIGKEKVGSVGDPLP